MTNINGNKKDIRCQSIRENTSLYKSIMDDSKLFNKISQISNLSEMNQIPNQAPTQISPDKLNNDFISNMFGDDNKNKDENSVRKFYENTLDSIGVPMDQKHTFISNNLKYSEDSEGKIKGSITIPLGIINRADSSRKEISMGDVRSIKEKLSSGFNFLTELKTDKSGYQIIFQTKPEDTNKDHEAGYLSINNPGNNTKSASLNMLLENSLERIRSNK